MYRRKRLGTRTEPWGAPNFKGRDDEFMSPTEEEKNIGGEENETKESV